MDRPDDSLITLLRQTVETVFGRCPMSPADFSLLSAHISQGNRHDSVAPSTLKRLWGYVRNNHRPTFTTLSVLARYGGYRDWNHFVMSKMQEDSDFSTGDIIPASAIGVGDTYLVEWGVGKSCMLCKTGEPGIFRISDACNIKLRKEDIVNIDVLAVGERFVARDCRRGELRLGTYIGARDGGIRAIRKATVDK